MMTLHKLSFSLLLFLHQPRLIISSASTPTPPTTSAACDPTQEDIRVYGGGGDAGRLELCHEHKWRYVCPDRTSSFDWSLSMATIGCKQLGFTKAFMAKIAQDMAMGSSVDSGIDPNELGIILKSCQGTKSSLFDCEYSLGSCAVDQALGMACLVQNDDTVQLDSSVEKEMVDIIDKMKVWEQQWNLEKKLLKQALVKEGESNIMSAIQSAPITTLSESTREIINPFTIDQVTNAFLFPQQVMELFGDLQTNFQRFYQWWNSYGGTNAEALSDSNPKSKGYNRTEMDAHVAISTILDAPPQSSSIELVGNGTSNKITPKSMIKLFQNLDVNAVGIDMSKAITFYNDNFHNNSILDSTQVTSLLSKPFFQTIQHLYFSSNRHNALHWYLDSPLRYATHPPSHIQLDKTAQKMYDILQRDGIVLIDNFGGDMEEVIRIAEESLTEEALSAYKNQSSVIADGSVITSRIPIPALEDILAHNTTIGSVINAYQGPSILHGYKTTRLTNKLTKADQYLAGLYHHDRVGRRLKAFVFMHDVDCDFGHPTKVAAGTNKLLFYRSEDYPTTRFHDSHVEDRYDIIKGCGKRGGGFLFDTHTIHKGSIQGEQERTVLIAEYHHIAKCTYAHEQNFMIPCPGGDLYRANIPL